MRLPVPLTLGERRSRSGLTARFVADTLVSAGYPLLDRALDTSSTSM